MTGVAVGPFVHHQFPDIFLQPSKVDYESGSETEKEIIQSHHKEEKIPLVTADQDESGKSRHNI